MGLNRYNGKDMKKIGLMMLVGIAFLGLSCEETQAPLECDLDLVCTENFVSLSYRPQDELDNGILLDNYYSQNLDNGNTYDFRNPDLARADSSYVLITDAQINEVQSSGTVIRFFGEANGQIIVEQDFLVGHDCCHVVLLQGPGTSN